VLPVFFRLHSDKSSNNFFDDSRLSNFNLVDSIELSTPSEVDLVEVERPEG
jgi:hypothetical protein